MTNHSSLADVVYAAKGAARYVRQHRYEMFVNSVNSFIETAKNLRNDLGLGLAAVGGVLTNNHGRQFLEGTFSYLLPPFFYSQQPASPFSDYITAADGLGVLAGIVSIGIGLAEDAMESSRRNSSFSGYLTNIERTVRNFSIFFGLSVMEKGDMAASLLMLANGLYLDNVIRRRKERRSSRRLS